MLIARARKLYDGETFGAELDETAYVLDATIIDLCLSLFPWLRTPSRQGRSQTPHADGPSRQYPLVFLWVSHARIVDAAFLDRPVPDPGAIYILDRGYVDFARLRRLVEGSAHFVVRAKKNLKTPSASTIAGWTRPRGFAPTRPSAWPIRRPRCAIPNRSGSQSITSTPKRKTGSSGPPTDSPCRALTVARLYKCRWQVQLFFKWIKQHLKIKPFYGTSMNAVQTQIWIAISVYLLLAIARKELRIGRSLSEIQQILKVTIFQKDPVLQLFSQGPISNPEINVTKQLSFLETNRTVVIRITITTVPKEESVADIWKRLADCRAELEAAGGAPSGRWRELLRQLDALCREGRRREEESVALLREAALVLSATSAPRVLELAIDAMIRLSGAQRGFILLSHAGRRAGSGRGAEHGARARRGRGVGDQPARGRRRAGRRRAGAAGGRAAHRAVLDGGKRRAPQAALGALRADPRRKGA